MVNESTYYHLSKANFWKNRLQEITILDVFKIAIILLVSFFLLAKFSPYYFGADALIYGLGAIDLVSGSYEYTNELFSRTGDTIFLPGQWAETVRNTGVPIGSTGIYGLGAIFYFLGGYSGLFYLGPIFTIALIICAERISTKLFGKGAGFLVLIFVVADRMIINHGQMLLTDNIFAVFILLGSFFLIKFFQNKKEKFLLSATIFFVIATFFRINGVVVFPLEILLVSGFFVIQAIEYTRREINVNEKKLITKFISSTRIYLSKIKSKKFVVLSLIILVPWLIFFSFYFGYNTYYFGDPNKNYEFVRKDITEESKGGFIRQYLKFDDYRSEWIKYFSVGLVPDNLRNNLPQYPSADVAEHRYKNWTSIIPFLIFSSSIAISLYDRKKRSESIVLVSIIMMTVLFYSSDFFRGDPNYTPGSSDIQERYMISSYVLTILLFSFLMDRIWKINFGKYFKKSGIVYRIPNIFFIIVLGSFIVFSFYSSIPVQNVIINSNWDFKDPQIYAQRYPLDLEGMAEKRIIVDTSGRKAVDYGAIPFTPYAGEYDDGQYDPTVIPDEQMQLLESMMQEGYDVYTFKNHRFKDPYFFRYIEVEHGLALKDFSSTFCKMEKIQNFDRYNSKKSSDDICYGKLFYLYFRYNL